MRGIPQGEEEKERRLEGREREAAKRRKFSTVSTRRWMVRYGKVLHRAPMQLNTRAGTVRWYDTIQGYMTQRYNNT